MPQRQFGRDILLWMGSDYHYPAELYELVHRGTPGDLAYYKRVCGGAEKILELGCGYGRVLSALSGLGARIVGLERNPGLLAAAERHIAALPSARERNIDLVLGDMRSFDLLDAYGPFDRILMPYSGVYCLLSDEACEACFRSIARHLAPDAQLVLDAYVAGPFHESANPADFLDESLDPVVSVEHAGAAYDVFERSRWDRESQRLDVTYEYIPRGAGEALQGALAHRYLIGSQLETLLDRGGLRLVSIRGDFEPTVGEPRPIPADCDVFVAVAVSKEEPTSKDTA